MLLKTSIERLMKRTVTLIMLFLLTYTSWGQNQFECAFGQTYEQVWSFISAKSFINAEKTSEGLILASNDVLEVQYHFFDGRLYSIETKKIFDGKGDSEETFHNLQRYFAQCNARIRHDQSAKSDNVFIAELKDSVCEVQLQKQGKVFSILQTHSQPQLSPNFARLATADGINR